ncbi:MAG: GAF domain-containing protein, partial [Myxococcota bacterium]
MTKAEITHRPEGPTHWVALALELALCLREGDDVMAVVRSFLRILQGASEIVAVAAQILPPWENAELVELACGEVPSSPGRGSALVFARGTHDVDGVRFEEQPWGVRVSIGDVAAIDLFLRGGAELVAALEMLRPVFLRLGEVVARAGQPRDIPHTHRGETKEGSSTVDHARISEEELVAPLLAVQQAVSRLSAALLSMEQERVVPVLREALAELGLSIGAKRAYVVEFGEDERRENHEWCAEGVSSRGDELSSFSLGDLPFLASQLGEGQGMCISYLHELPKSATKERDLLERGGVTTALFAPMMVEGRLYGVVSVEGLHANRPAPLTILPSLQLFADALSVGLLRLRQRAVQDSLHAKLSRKAEQQHAMLVLSDEFARAENQQELFVRLRASLRLVTGLERLELTELTPDKERFRVYTLEQLSAGVRLRVDEKQIPNALDEYILARSSVEEALRLGQPVTSRERAIERFHDWCRRQNEQGHEHFITVPLVGSASHFATLGVSFARPQPVTVDETEALAQLGSLLAAHLSIHEAREDLHRWNSTLEARVERRT